MAVFLCAMSGSGAAERKLFSGQRAKFLRAFDWNMPDHSTDQMTLCTVIPLVAQPVPYSEAVHLGNGNKRPRD
jgi:hypothetical protein